MNVEREKAISDWLSDVEITSKPSDEAGIFLNKIFFTHKNGAEIGKRGKNEFLY